jgi:hypothetical protein
MLPDLLERMLRAARLDAGLIADLDGDPGATGQALLVAALAAAAGGIGAAAMGSAVVIPLMVVAGAVGWLLFAALAWVLGAKLLAEPRTAAEFPDAVRALGFATAPGVLQMLGIVPVLGAIMLPVANLWMLAASVVLLRRAFAFTGWGRPIAVLVLAAAIGYGLVLAGVMMSPAGALFTAPTEPLTAVPAE